MLLVSRHRTKTNNYAHIAVEKSDGTCRVAFLQNLNVAIVNGVPLKQHVQLHQLPCMGTPFIAFRIAPSPPR